MDDTLYPEAPMEAKSLGSTLVEAQALAEARKAAVV